jgi:hypothetical protein
MKQTITVSCSAGDNGSAGLSMTWQAYMRSVTTARYSRCTWARHVR